MSDGRPIAFDDASANDDPELARAELYGLLTLLWLAPPDDALRRQFAVAVTQAPTPGSFLESPWQQLVGVMRAISPADARREYEALFLGIGKPEVFLYGSYYQAGFLNETPLVELRTTLQQIGLERDSRRGETEDHIASTFDVMRYLIAGDDAAVCNLEQQRRFFRAHVQPWVERLCDAVQAHPQARLYAAVAGLTRAFVQVETQAFDMLE